LQRLRVIIMTL